ncbi:MAG: type III pantothenate kinase [Leptolyngbyaceae cyanobacterium SM2_5_2]|nr:type III pantothenate kinase [Leptolyngbyaceae cyanobacterium SM2_5_2]
MLVVDCGTALTFTAGDDDQFLGGAITPGLKSQLKALHESTDGLPLLSPEAITQPNRWAITTAEAMLSGVVYTQLASIRDFLADWWARFPVGRVVLTGGDSKAVVAGLIVTDQALAERLHLDPNLMFWGLRACRQRPSTAL